MPKMSIERFREMKARLAELAEMAERINNDELELSEEEEERIGSEITQIADEIHTSDLSDIPFEEYEGFYNFGFDFSGTGANIDFNIITTIVNATVRFKGCNVRNFDFDTMSYDEDSFDEEFKRDYPDRFLDESLPKDVRKRYYDKRLEVSDVLKYELYDKVERDRVPDSTYRFFQKVKPEVANIIDLDLFEIIYFRYSFLTRVQRSDAEEITEEEVRDIMRGCIEEVLSQNYLDVESYKKIIRNPRIGEFISDDRIIDFGENDELAERYINHNLNIGDIYVNQELFRGKKFVERFQSYRFYPERFEKITEEKVLYLFENYPDVSEAFIWNTDLLYSFVADIDLEASKEENFKTVQARVVEVLESEESEYIEPDTKRSLERYYSLEIVKNHLGEYDRSRFETIMSYTTEEKLQSYGIPPRAFENSGVLYLFSQYGIDTVMEFDRANGNIFSNNNFELASKMYDYYFHYAGNVQDPNRSIYYRSKTPEDWQAPYSMEDFEECVRRMIVEGPTEWKYSKEQPIDYRNFSQEFKDRNPRMFLEKDAPPELQDKFYTKTLEISDFAIHPDWVDYLEEKDFEIGVQRPGVIFINATNYAYKNIFDVLRGVENSESAILSFLRDNASTIKLEELYQRKSQNNSCVIDLGQIKTLEEFKDFFNGRVENLILSGALEYGEPYIPDFFREKHPDLVLDENAPEELKAKFYSLYYEEGHDENRASLHTLTLQDLANEEFRPFLEGKSFELLKDADLVKNITKVFSFEEITDLYNIDPDAFELYCFNLENAVALKEALDNYPQLYAKEELMSGLGLSQEEFELRLQSDEEFKNQFESLKRGYVEDFIKNPGFVLFVDPESRSRETLKQYKELSASNMLHNSNRYSRDSYEQILGHMLGFLGYEEAKKLLEVPEIDEETLSRIYEHDEVIKSLYEKKFEITGNLKVISKLLEGFPALMPTPEKITSKATCKLFMSLNKRIQEGYNGDITSLITEVLSENNVEVDSEKVNQLVENVIKTSTQQKLDLVRENNSMIIDTSIEENQKTRNALKRHYRNALEYSLNKSEKVDPALVREYLEKEFSRLNEEGLPHYSPHVTEHLEDLVSFAEDLNNSPEWSLKLNHSVVDDLREEAGKIGKGWIRKITSNICYRPEKMTYEEAEALDGMIYPEGSGFEVDTLPTIGLKELSEEEKAKVYELLTNDDYRGMFTYGKAENMFATLKLPYSQRFKEFFLEHKDEFISNPDLFSKFPILASKFDSYLEEAGFNTKFKEGTLTPENLLLKLASDVYPNIEVGKGEHELIYQAKQAGLTEEQAIIALRLFKDMPKREYQTVPPEQYETKRFRGRIVRMDDPLHFAIGEITNCCQTIGEGQPGETSMIHSATERNGALFIVEELDENGDPIGIVSQSWTWRNGNRVCFDNVEIPDKVESQLKQEGGFDEIMEVYQEAARRMIETDRIKLKKLLESGKITESQYQSMVIKDVGMGLGCDDLVHNLSSKKRDTIPSLSAVSPIEIGKTYTGANSRTLYTDSKTAVLVAHNDDFSPDDHVHSSSEVGDYGVKYTKTREIFRRRGFDIDSDKLESISKMVQKNDRASAFSNNPIHIYEVASHFGIQNLEIADADRVKISMSETGDWYVLYEETEDGIIVLESGVDTSNPETELDKQDRKMALGEYTREMHRLMLDSATKGKPMTIDSYSRGKFINLDSLVSQGIISEDNGAIVVKDDERLKEIIVEYDKVLDDQRRKRINVIDMEEHSK